MSERKERDPYAPWLSCWFITYNTNSTDVNLIRPLEDTWNYMMTNLTYYLRTWNTPTVEVISVKEAHAIERGGKFHRIHLHAKVQVDTRGLAMLDYQLMKRNLNTILKTELPSFKGGYFWVRLFKQCNTLRLMEQYLKKAPLKVPSSTKVEQPLQFRIPRGVIK